MKFSYALAFATVLFFTFDANAQTITCDRLEKAATEIYNRTAETANRNELVLANESRKAFWDVVSVEKTCPGIEKLAKAMRESELAKRMQALTMSDVINSYRITLDGHCKTCEIVPKTRGTSNSQGYEIESSAPYTIKVNPTAKTRGF